MVRKGQPCRDLGKELSKQKEQDSGEHVMTRRWAARVAEARRVREKGEGRELWEGPVGPQEVFLSMLRSPWRELIRRKLCSDLYLESSLWLLWGGWQWRGKKGSRVTGRRPSWSSRWVTGSGNWDLVVDCEKLLESGYFGGRVNRAYI